MCALMSLYQMNTDECTYVLFKHYISLRHVSAHKGTTSGSVTDIFPRRGQQNESPGVKFSLVSSVYCVNVAAISSHMAGDSLFSP